MILLVSLSRFVAADMESAVLDFVQLATDGQAVERLEGRLYFQSPDFIALEFHFPINQLIILSGDGTLIFYPDTLEAFQFPPDSAAVIPISSQFQSTMSQDRGLAQAGFELDLMQVTENNVILSRWTPPPFNLSAIKDVQLYTSADGHIIRTETRGDKETIMASVDYSNFHKDGRHSFPGLIVSRQYNRNQELVSEMTVEYRNIAFNVALPPEIVDFSLPEGSDLKVLEW